MCGRYKGSAHKSESSPMVLTPTILPLKKITVSVASDSFSFGSMLFFSLNFSAAIKRNTILKVRIGKKRGGGGPTQPRMIILLHMQHCVCV